MNRAIPQEESASSGVAHEGVLGRFADIAQAEVAANWHGERLPLSHQQERLWFVDRAADDGAVLLVRSVWELRGALDLVALHRAVAALASRHEMLTTTYGLEEGRPVQRIRAGKFGFDLLAGADTDLSEASIRALVDSVTGTPLDIERLVARIVVIRRSADAYVLILVLHHIATDGQSIQLLLDELAARYSAEISGAAGPAVEGPAIDYGDYVQWQQQLVAQPTFDALVERAVERLRGFPTELLRFGRAVPRAVGSTAGRRIWLPVAPRLGEAVQSTAARNGTTPLIVGLCAHGILLSRLTANEQVLVGTPLSGRSRAEIRNTLGCFVELAPIPIRVDADATFSEHLARVRSSVLEAVSAEAVPFKRIVDGCQPSSRSTRQPLVQSVFTLREPSGPWSLQGLEANIMPFENSTAKFELQFALRVRGDPQLFVECMAELFDEDDARRIGEQYLAVLDAITADPTARVGALMLGPPATLARLPAVRERGACASPMVQIFARASERPDATALRCGSRELSYGALVASAAALASGPLAPLPGSRIGIVSARTIESVIAMLAAAMDGRAYVPLDGRLPDDRLRDMCRVCGVEAVCGEEASAGDLARRLGLQALAISCTDAATPPAPGFFADASARLSRHRPLYVIHTSGSTGQPKGVEVTHGNVAALLEACFRQITVDASDRWSVFHNVAFDFSVWEILGALASGGTAVLIDETTVHDPTALLELLRSERISVLSQTPTAFAALLPTALREPRCASLRYVVFGGERLDVERLGRWFAAFGDCEPQLINMYGITETTVHVTVRPISAADVLPSSVGSPIGTPLAHLDVHVVSADFQPCATGEPGELVVAGDGLALGYVGAPAETALRFRPDPFGPPGARIYCSGDIGRVKASGELEYLGRSDRQVKVRGFRIELGEVEAALRSHPAVQDAHCVLESARADLQIEAYLVPDPERAHAIHCLIAEAPPGGDVDRQLFHPRWGRAIEYLNRSELEFMLEEIDRRDAYGLDSLDLPPAPVVMDVGANIGVFSLACLHRFPGAHVIALEPVPDICRILARNLRTAESSAQVLELAAGRSEAPIQILYLPGASVLSSARAVLREDALASHLARRSEFNLGGPDKELLDELVADRLRGRPVSCRQRPLSDVLDELDLARLDLLKIDVEGMELDVLAGIAPHQWKRIAAVAVEVPAAGLEETEVIRMLEAQGFVVAAYSNPSAAGFHVVTARRDDRPAAATYTARIAP